MVFLRLLKYSLRYRTQFVAGIIIAFFVAALNGLSLTALLPFFDALGDKSHEFTVQVSRAERNIIKKAMLKPLSEGRNLGVFRLFELPTTDPEWRVLLGLDGPQRGQKMDRAISQKLLRVLPLRDKSLTTLENLQLRYVILWKLRLNANGFRPIEVIYWVLLIYVPLVLLRLGLLIATVRLIARSGYRGVRDIRAALYAKVQELPLTFFYTQRSGVIMSRMINDAETIAAVISSNMRDSITNIFIIVVNLTFLAFLNAELLFWAILTVPLMLSPVTLFSRKIRKSTGKSQEYLADLNGLVQEAIAGVKVIRSFAMEGYEKEQFRAANQKLYWRSFKQQFYLRASPNLVELTSALVVVGILGLGTFFVDGVDFTFGDFFVFLLLLLSMIRPIIQLSGMMAKITQASEAGRRIFELLDRPRDLLEPRVPEILRPMRKHLEFKNVSFIYPETEKTVLDRIDLHVEAGQTVALIGESGSGKSTLVDLMARFFDPTEGSIRIDGHDIRDFRIVDHRSRIGIVQQENFLFHGSVRENIAYGRPDVSIREIMKAARLAHAHDFIKQLPGKYDAMIGEKGLNLSGGQRQRIAIARALLRDPEILILDEATSALDTQSERLVQHALERLFRNRTVFVIAHRLSTIEKADAIIVLSGGQIVDKGRHEDLMKKGGLYARLQEISRETLPGSA